MVKNEKQLNRCFALQNYRIAEKSGIIFLAYWNLVCEKYDSAFLCNSKIKNGYGMISKIKGKVVILLTKTANKMEQWS